MSMDSHNKMTLAVLVLSVLVLAGCVVVLDEAAAKSATTTMQSDVYAFIFSQKGLMAGLGLQGSKISKIDK